MKSITIKVELDDNYWRDEDYAGDKSGELLLADVCENRFECGVTHISVVSVEPSKKNQDESERMQG